jgi:choline dehydrogenase
MSFMENCWGSSAINGAAAVLRALHGDFSRWTRAGLKGWNWEDVLPYLKNGDFNVPKSQWHGYRSFSDHQMTKTDITRTFAVALINDAVENGFREIDDFNAGEQHGVRALPMNIVNGKRKA